MYTNRYSTIKKTDSIVQPISEIPNDTVSGICFNDNNTIFAAVSWDCTVSIYSITYDVSAQIRRLRIIPVPAAALSVTWLGQMVVVGLTSGALVVVDSGTGAVNSMPAHSAGVKCLESYGGQYVISAGFDATLKIWDLKSGVPLYSTSLPAKAYASALAGGDLALLLANKTVLLYSISALASGTGPSTFQTKFTYSVRSLAQDPAGLSIAIGGIEAKVEILTKQDAKSFVARVHRDAARLYSSNLLSYYPPNSSILVSGGSDGNLVWFDKNNRMKIHTNTYSDPITAGKFSSDGKFFIFATGDDWSKGYSNNITKVNMYCLETKSIPGINK